MNILILEILISRLSSGIVPVLIKLTNANAFQIGFVRLTIAWIGFLLITKFQKTKIKFTKKNILPCLAIGLFFGLHWIFYFLSIKLSTVTIATIGVSSYGIFLTLIGNIFFKEKITKTEIIALIVSITGCLIIIPSYNFSNAITIGFLLGLLNALFFAITGALQKHYSKKIPANTRIFSQYFFAFFLFIPPNLGGTWQITHIDWIYLVILGVLGTLVSHTLWISTVEKLNLKTSATVYYLSTFFSIAAGVIILKDPISLKTFIGGTMIIAASIIVLLKQKPPKEVIKSTEN